MKKIELLEALEDSHNELSEMLADLPDEALEEAGVSGSWSIKDILAHLSMWEGQLVTLLFQVNQEVAKPTTVHFGKEAVDEINHRWHTLSQERSLEHIWQDWMAVRKQTIRRLADFNDNDLNDPKRYAWLKGAPLIQWILNSTVEHEDKHADDIREWLDRKDIHSRNGNKRA